MATDLRTEVRTEQTVERNNRRTRWFHAGIYLLVLALLATGWWLLAGREGRQPVVPADRRGRHQPARVRGLGAVLGLGVVGAVLGWRAVATLLGDSVPFQRSDLRWFARWPSPCSPVASLVIEGRFDPGQRVMNLVVLVLLLVLVGSEIGLTQVVGGPAFVWLVRLHKWANVVTPVLLGHILVASGVLPGYRGAWRAMHLGGRLPARSPRRLWPAWLDEKDRP